MLMGTFRAAARSEHGVRPRGVGPAEAAGTDRQSAPLARAKGKGKGKSKGEAKGKSLGKGKGKGKERGPDNPPQICSLC